MVLNVLPSDSGNSVQERNRAATLRPEHCSQDWIPSVAQKTARKHTAQTKTYAKEHKKLKEEAYPFHAISYYFVIDDILTAILG